MVSEQDGSAAIDEVEAALRAISSDSCALNRLAVISTLRLNGEAAWVCELAFQLTRAGRDVRLEVAVYPDLKQKADLVVAGEVFELKSTFTAYAVTAPEEATRKWMIKDVHKMRQGGRTGHQIITVATMAGALHLVADPERRRPGAVSRINERISQNDREAALEIYKRYAETVAVDPVRLVDIGRGSVPNDRGEVQLDALLACVHRPPA